MTDHVKIIATIGPSSRNQETLEKLKSRGVDFFRINMSHTPEGEIEERVKDLIGTGVPIILDTEGLQIRSGNTEEIHLREGDVILVHPREVVCDEKNLFLNPPGITGKLKQGDLISIDFNSALLKVLEESKEIGEPLKSLVLIGGLVGGRKAVQIDSPTLHLPPFSRKDYKAMEIGKKYGIKHFTLSFMESPKDVEKFRKEYPGSILYSKIESKLGLENFIEIAKVSDGVLIDRGDLSHQIPIEKIPFVQKYIIKKVRELGKEAFVATNTLEQMALTLKPSRAETNDIINTILDGATGIALTKETAVGKNPGETVNMLVSLIKQTEFINKFEGDTIEKIEKSNYVYSNETPGLLIEPHGGKLVDRTDFNFSGELPEKNIEVNEKTLMDVEQIAVGAFSPLKGFMGHEDFMSVADGMRLKNGTVWTIPITLDVDEKTKDRILVGEKIGLKFEGETMAILDVTEIYQIDKKDCAGKLFGTYDESHPGVKNFMDMKDYLVGGEITLIERRKSPNKANELTPKQARKIFSERGWSRVLGFHTRNVIHRSHEFVQMEGLKRSLCDGLFIHPVVGMKKKGDFMADSIIKTYETMVEKFYPKSKVVFATLGTYSRYMGPREAIFTALIRKNFGCSHFIVGRDHTGVGKFYGAEESQKIFDSFPKPELGIEAVKFGEVFYSGLENKHLHSLDFEGHPEDQKLSISGTQAREMLMKQQSPPEWFMRKEIAEIIIEKIKNGEKVFFE